MKIIFTQNSNISIFSHKIYQRYLQLYRQSEQNGFQRFKAEEMSKRLRTNCSATSNELRYANDETANANDATTAKSNANASKYMSGSGLTHFYFEYFLEFSDKSANL